MSTNQGAFTSTNQGAFMSTNQGAFMSTNQGAFMSTNQGAFMSTNQGAFMSSNQCELSDRRQRVRLGKHVSDSTTISTGSPQGCVLSPLLFSLYTNSCTSSHQSVKLFKFADDTTLIGLISGGDESAYRWEIDHLVTWCGQKNLELNALKTVEMVVDFRKNPAPTHPHHPERLPSDPLL